MMDQQWEFCVLYLYDRREGRKGKEKGKLYYDLAVRYFDNVGTPIQTLSQLEDDGGTAWAHNPWAGAMAQLGGFGWELVSVQHPNVPNTIGGGALSWSNCVAYFKRPVKAGIGVDEPKLTLE